MNDLNWFLGVSFVVAGLIEMAAPIGLAVWIIWRFHARWRFFWIGVLVFLLSQGVTRIPAMVALQSLPAVRSRMADPLFLWSFFAFAAFTAGLFEETGRWIAVRYAVAPADRTWRSALMLGAGHGGLESFGIGLLALATLVGYVVLTLTPGAMVGEHQPHVQAAARQFAAMQGWEPLLGAWERLCALALHLAFSVMVMLSFQGGARWWWLALAAHAAVDFLTVGTLRLASKAWGGSAGMLVTGAVVGVLAAAATAFIWTTRARIPVDSGALGAVK